MRPLDITLEDLYSLHTLQELKKQVPTLHIKSITLTKDSGDFDLRGLGMQELIFDFLNAYYVKDTSKMVPYSVKKLTVNSNASFGEPLRHKLHHL